MSTKTIQAELSVHVPQLSLRKKLLFASISLGLFLLFADLILHLFVPIVRGPQLYEADPELGYRLRPNLAGRRRIDGAAGYYSVRTDAEGRRVVPCSAPPTQPGELLLLGDSMAFGQGVDDEHTLAAHLALAGFHVVNLATPGYGTNQELLSFRRYMRTPHSISWLVVIVCTNDGTDVRSSFRHMRHSPTASLVDGRLVLDPFTLPLSDRLFDKSYLYAAYRWRLQASSQVMQPGDGPRIVAACLQCLKQEAESAGARTSFLIGDAMHPNQAIPFVEAASERKVRLVDLSEELHGHIAQGEDLLIDGLHWNTVGTKLVTDKLLTYLARTPENAPSTKKLQG